MGAGTGIGLCMVHSATVHVLEGWGVEGVYIPSLLAPQEQLLPVRKAERKG